MSSLSPRRFATLFFLLPWTLLAVGIVFSALFPAAALRSGLGVLLVSALVFGMPHGACDLWAMQRAMRRRWSRNESQSSTRCDVSTRARKLFDAKWCAAYIAVALAMLMLWRINAPLALGVFLFITVWHFGSADAWLHRVSSDFATADSASPSASPSATSTRAHLPKLARCCLSWGRGLLVIGAPLALQPAATHEILRHFAALSAPAFDISSWWRFALPLLLLGIVLQGVGQFLSVWPRRSSARTSGNRTSSTRCRNWTRWDSALWIESVLLLALFAVVPPLLAVACYFLALHSWRHLLRLQLFSEDDSASQKPRDNASLDNRDSTWLWATRAVVRQHAQSLLPTLATFLGLIPILVWWPALLHDALQWNVAYLVLVSAVTLPHMMVIAWLESQHNL